MTREKVIQIGNELLQNKGDFSAWIELISDYVDEKDKSKTDTIVKIFPSLSQSVQIRLLNIALEYFTKKLEVNYVSKETENSSWIINGVPQKTSQILCYF